MPLVQINVDDRGFPTSLDDLRKVLDLAGTIERRAEDIGDATERGSVCRVSFLEAGDGIRFETRDRDGDIDDHKLAATTLALPYEEALASVREAKAEAIRKREEEDRRRRAEAAERAVTAELRQLAELVTKHPEHAAGFLLARKA